MHGDGLYKEIYLNELRPGRFQPRRTFEAVKLLELAESIKKQGVMDPPVVFLNEASCYELIAGERRWRACCALALEDRMAEGLAEAVGLTSLESWPQVVREGTWDQPLAGTALVVHEQPAGLSEAAQEVQAIVSNVQREDLTRMEEAEAYAKLKDRGWSVRQIAAEVGKSKSYVDDTLKLLALDPAVVTMIQAEESPLEIGLARELGRKVATDMQPVVAETLQKRIEKGETATEAKKSIAEVARFLEPNRWSLSHDPDRPFHPVWFNRARLIRHLLESTDGAALARGALELEGKRQGQYTNYLRKSVGSILGNSWDFGHVAAGLAGIKATHAEDAWTALAGPLGWGCESCALAGLVTGIEKRVDHFDGWRSPCKRLRRGDWAEVTTCEGYVGPDDPPIVTLPDAMVDWLDEGAVKTGLQGNDQPYVTGAADLIRLYEAARVRQVEVEQEAEIQAMTQHIAPIQAYWEAQGEGTRFDLGHFQAHACRKCVHYTENYLPGGGIPPCTLIENPPKRNGQPRAPEFGVLANEERAVPRCEKFRYRELPAIQLGFEAAAIPDRAMILLWYEWLVKDNNYGGTKYIWKPLNWLNGRSLAAVWADAAQSGDAGG